MKKDENFPKPEQVLGIEPGLPRGSPQIVSTSPWNLGQSRQIIHLERQITAAVISPLSAGHRSNKFVRSAPEFTLLLNPRFLQKTSPMT